MIQQTCADISDFIFRLLSKYIMSPSSPANRLIHVKGQNSLGKSIFIRTFLNYLYTSGTYFSNTYIIDTEQKYSRTNIQANISPDFRPNVFLCHQCDFSELITLINELETIHIPPKSIIVIDSLSNILKQMNADCNSYHLLQKFNTKFLSKLISLLTRKDLFCFLVHHISHNPLLGDVPSYYTSIVQNLEGIWLSLEKIVGNLYGSEPVYEKRILLTYTATTTEAILSQFSVQYQFSIQHGNFILGEKVDG